MIKNLYGAQKKIIKYFLLLIYLFSLLYLSGWFNLNKEIPINLDELAWVQDSQVFEWRLNQDWENFSWSEVEKSGWMSHDFRLFDQPHFVKYVYGYIFTIKNTQPWLTKKQQEKNYLQFTQQYLSGKIRVYENNSKEIFGINTIKAIFLARKINTLVGIGFITIITIFLARQFSINQSLMVSFLIITNPIFQYNFNIATADSISMFFILITLLLFYSIFKKNKYKKVTLILSSITSAIATSSKINGWILIIISISVIMMIEKDAKKMLKKLFSWLSLFIGFYIYLQPELWNYPISGFIRYFSQRIIQQMRFEIDSQSLNIFSYHYWLLKLYLGSKNEFLYLIKVGMLFFNSLLILRKIRLFLMLSFKKIKEKINNFLKNNYLVLLIFLLIWIIIFLYAKIGFERYAMWPLIVIFVISSRLIEKLFHQTLFFWKKP